MKYVKMLGLLAVAAAALMAFAASASATTVTSGGSAYTGEIAATNEGGLTLHGVVDVTCNHSSVIGKEIESHGAGVTAKGKINTLTFSNCTQHVVVLNAGTLEAHTVAPKTGESKNNATLTSSGAEVTVQFTTIFGNVHCVFGTNNTDVGTLTSSGNTGGKATLDIDSAPIPVKSGSGLCGSSAEWTGNYVVNTPANLEVD